MWTAIPRRFKVRPTIMESMAQRLGETAHCSPLLRKARKHGVATTPQMVQLAVARGCRHYAGVFDTPVVDPGADVISDEELVTLLLLGEHSFEPFAVRCAAQLLTACDPAWLVRLARQEWVTRALAYLATAGRDNDPANATFWNDLITRLENPRAVPPGRLPHWSRFVSQTGCTRQGPGRTVWLRATR